MGWNRTYRHLRVISMQGADVESEFLVGNGSLADAEPQWSQDGKHLAVLFSEGSDAIQEKVLVRVLSLSIIAPDGSGGHTVTGGVISRVSWSPDGKRLAFVRRHGQSAQLVTIATDGSAEHVIRSIGDLRGVAMTLHETGESFPLSHVAWSPDGAHILYGCGYQFCVVNLDGDIVGRTP